MRALLLLLAGCRVATPVDLCEVDPKQCLACETDADCRFTGNPCLDTVYCAHVDATTVVPMLGCDAMGEHRWPAAETCHCVGTCTSH